MAGKGRRVAGIVLAVLAGIVLLVLAAVPVVLGTPLASRLVSTLTEDIIDADIRFSRLRVSVLRSWPDVGVSLDSLCITYPHGRFAQVALLPLQQDGTGVELDTLLVCRRLELSAGVPEILKGSFRIPAASADGLRVFAHNYGNGMASWNVFRSSSGGGGSMPSVTMGRLSLTDSWAAVSSKGGLWKIAGPVDAELSGSMQGDSLSLSVDVQRLHGNIAGLPIELSGKLENRTDSTFVDARARLQAAPLKVLLEDFAWQFVPSSKALSADGTLDLDLRAEGLLSEDSMPALEASVSVPGSKFNYRPLRISGSVSLDASASSDSRMVVDAELRRFAASIPGLSAKGGGKVLGLFGRDPLYSVRLDADTRLETISRQFLSGTGISAAGDADLHLEAEMHDSELRARKFDAASFKGHLDAPALSVRYDSLSAELFNPCLRASSGSDGIALGLDVDSTFVDKGELRLRLRSSSNLAHLHGAEDRGRKVSRLDMVSSSAALFVGSGAERAGARGVRIVAGLQQRPRPDMAAMRRARRDPSWAEKLEAFQKADSLREFKDKDVRIALDSTLSAWLREWTPNASVELGRGFVASPSLPLRTRIGSLRGQYDGRDFLLDTLRLSCGTSDLAASGKIRSVMRIFSRRRSAVDASLKLSSDRLNVNEIMAAFDYGRSMELSGPAGEEDEGFVLDSIPDAKAVSGSGLIVVPGNVNAALDFDLARVDYGDFMLTPLRGSASVRDATLQVLGLYADAGMAKIGLDAFYSTKSKKDISAGAKLQLREVFAGDVISVLPFVDSLLPALKSFHGRLDCDLSASTRLDEHMNVITPSLQGVINISGRDLAVDDAGSLRRITRLLMFKNVNIGQIRDMSVSAVIKDSKAEIYPFEIGVDRYNFALQGIQGFDGSMNYHVSVLKSPFLVPFGIYMRGTVDDWHFGLCRARYRSGKVPAYSVALDSVSINFAESIRNVYQLGVEGVRRHNERTLDALDSPMGGQAASRRSEEPVDAADYKVLDAVQLDNEIAAQEEALRESIEALLSGF